jgi:DNA topoisomerase VI subunit A
MQLVHQVLGKGIHVTKRDMFYTDVKLFNKQEDSDGVGWSSKGLLSMHLAQIQGPCYEN